MPMLTSWLYTLLVASVLAHKAAQKCRSDIHEADMCGTRGNRLVALQILVEQPIQTMQEQVLDPLSKGWGLTAAHCLSHLALLVACAALEVITDVVHHRSGGTPVKWVSTL
eukprot:COSAG01_NODE_8565_length_2739_cov_4.887597_1_plen_110_part_10